MSNRINLSFDQKRLANLGLSIHLRRCINEALGFQGVDVPCEINVLVTDDQGIRVINQASRDIDKETDVLSFPLYDFEAPSVFDEKQVALDGDVRALGDIVISVEKINEQAKEYGHSVEREMSYMTVHSMLHLLGYDHENNVDMEQIMFKKQKEILSNMGITRE